MSWLFGKKNRIHWVGDNNKYELEGYSEKPGKFPSDIIACFEVGKIKKSDVRIRDVNGHPVRTLWVECAGSFGKKWKVKLPNRRLGIKTSKIVNGILEVYLEHD